MSTYLETLTTEQILGLAQKAKRDIDFMQMELNLFTAALAQRAMNTPGKHIVGTVGSYTVSENNTYDEMTIRAQLSPGQVKRCTVPKLDKAVVKRLYPAVYDAAKKNNGVKVSIG